MKNKRKCEVCGKVFNEFDYSKGLATEHICQKCFDKKLKQK